MDNGMTSLLRRIAFAFVAAVGISLPASATTFSIDYTDLWYIPTESGWGLNVIQQGNVMFATLFVYGTDNTPRWYVASDVESSNGTTWTGVLYKTTGPYFGVPWTGSANVTPAGSLTLTFNTISTGTLTYVADGVTVTKQVQRTATRTENIAGTYLGGLTASGSSCNGVNNGPILIFGGPVVVTQNTSSGATSIVVNFTNSNGVAGVCTFNGTYTQIGKPANFAGTWSCTIGGSAYNNGSFTMSELEATLRGFNARFTGSDQFCQYAGNFGVVRDIQ
jgi:hypothetical protein